MPVPAAYIGVILIWSTTPLAIQWSSEEVGFLFGVTARMLLGVVTGFAITRLLKISLPWHSTARCTYLAAGLGIFFAMLSVYWSSQFIPSGWISVIFGLAPLVTGLMAARWLAEDALIPVRVAGMLLGLGGLAFVFAAGQTLGPQTAYGIIGMVISVILYSASAVAVKRIGAEVPALAVTTGGLAIASPLFLAVYFIAGEGIPATVPLRPALSIVYLGLVGSVLGFALYYYVLRRVAATRVALIALLTPVLALLLGRLLNSEPVRAEVWIGAGLILCGLLLYEYGPALSARMRQPRTLDAEEEG